jgi:hypothetical protein
MQMNQKVKIFWQTAKGKMQVNLLKIKRLYIYLGNFEHLEIYIYSYLI